MHTYPTEKCAVILKFEYSQCFVQYYVKPGFIFSYIYLNWPNYVRLYCIKYVRVGDSL